MNSQFTQHPNFAASSTDFFQNSASQELIWNFLEDPAGQHTPYDLTTWRNTHAPAEDADADTLCVEPMSTLLDPLFGYTPPAPPAGHAPDFVELPNGSLDDGLDPILPSGSLGHGLESLWKALSLLASSPLPDLAIPPALAPLSAPQSYALTSNPLSMSSPASLEPSPRPALPIQPPSPSSSSSSDSDRSSWGSPGSDASSPASSENANDSHEEFVDKHKARRRSSRSGKHPSAHARRSNWRFGPYQGAGAIVPPPVVGLDAPSMGEATSHLTASHRRNVQLDRSATTTPSVPLLPGQCGHCPKVLRRRSDLARHVESHFGDPNDYACVGIPWRLAVREMSEEKLRACEEHGGRMYDGQWMVGGCGHAFSRRDALGRHLRQTEVGRGCLGRPHDPWLIGNRKKAGTWKRDAGPGVMGSNGTGCV